jgi:integrase
VRTLELSIAKAIGAREIGADPILAADMHKLVRTLDHSVRGDRARAMSTLCFAGSFRSAELVALERRQLAFTSDGLDVLIARSKEDPRGRGRVTHIPFGDHPETCPVRAITRWLERVGDLPGPVFRELRGARISDQRMSTRAISRAVQRAAAAIDLHSTERGFSSHSFRKGLITSAEAEGRSLSEIADHCRCKEQSLTRYILRRHAPAGRRSVVAGML